MKRWLVERRLVRWVRAAATLSGLAQTQEALQKGRSVAQSEAAAFYRFCAFDAADNTAGASKAKTPKSTKQQGTLKLRAEFSHIVDTLKAEADNRRARGDGGSTSSDTMVSASASLPVFLAALDAKKNTFRLYSVTDDKLLTHQTSLTGDAWELADSILTVTGGEQQFILLPVVTAEKERAALATPRGQLREQLRACGLQPVAHVDTLGLANALVKELPPLRKLLGEASGPRPTAGSLEWFRAQWMYLRTLACQSTSDDPLSTVRSLVLPRHTVFVVHLVRAGSRSMNVSLYEPARRRRWTSKGMLSDILATLFETHTKHMILIPTNRTDRALLYRCRTALRKVGNDCVIAFASDVDEKYRKAYSSEPSRYWAAMKDITKTLDADLIFQFRVTAGNGVREFRKKEVHATEARGSQQAAASHTEDGAAGSSESVLASQTNVEAWLSQFRAPARQKAERAVVQHYQKYLVVSYVAGNVLDRGQPSNPLSPLNYVVAACLQDASGHILEPWTKYTARGAFSLPSLSPYEVLVTHDAKQLLVHMWHDEELQRFLARGGRVWCTMLAEYLLSAQRQRTGHLSLQDVAMRYGRALAPSSKLGTTNAQLPLSFLREYLVPAAPALVTVFQEQVRLGVERSQMISLAHRMDSLLAMAAMEVAGIFIDVSEAERQAKTWRTAEVTLDRALQAYTPLEIPVDMRQYFDWHAVTHTHAYFFGGTVVIGQGMRARHTALWTSNLVHLCHAHGPFAQMVGEVYLQQYATQCKLTFQGSTKLPQAISQYIESHGTGKRKSYRIVLFDLETTGLNVFTDEVIEVAFYDPVEKKGFTSLVRPNRRLSPRTTGIHHITEAMVRDAPTMETVTAGIVKFLRLDKENFNADEITLLIGHNVFSLDEPMLRRALDQFSPDTTHDGLLYCDSIVLLQMLKQELSTSKSVNGGRGRKVDKGLLDVLSSSLRLSSLVERLHVRPEGAMHRAETDTKALWGVLLAVLGLGGKGASAQRDAVLAEAARSLLTYPAAGCFVPTVRKTTALQVHLPGVAHGAVANAKTVKQLAAKPISDETLKILHGHGVAVAGLLLQRQRLQQHAANFLQPGGDGSITTVHADHAVHQHIDMTATTTSRTTSLYPSCQNIPKDDKSSVRRLFVSRFGPKGRCVEVDYSQLEIVVLAILCRDAQLTKDLNSGVDFHVKRAAFFSGLPYQEIFEGYQRRVPKYVALRKTAKQFSFQRLYGAGIPLLHKTTGIAPKDLEASIAAENREYPGIAQFHQLIRSVALRPNNPGLPTGLIAEMPTGLQLNFRSRDVVLNLPPMKNYPIQGYGAELAQIMLGRLMRRFLETTFYGKRAYLVNFVHDSVWLDCHVDVLSEVVADTCRILSDVHRYVPSVFPGVHIDVPLHVAASCGVNMCAMQDLEGDRSSAPAGKRPAAAKPKSSSHGTRKTKSSKKTRPTREDDDAPTTGADDDADGDEDAVKLLLDDVDHLVLDEMAIEADEEADNTPVTVHL